MKYKKNIFGNEIKEFIPFKNTILECKELYEDYIETNKFLFTNSFYIEKEEKLIDFLIKVFAKECSIKELISNENEDNKIFEKNKRSY